MRTGWIWPLSIVVVAASISWTACTDATNTDGVTAASGTGTTSAGSAGATSSGTGANDPFAQCSKGQLEADRVEDVPFTGPGVDSTTGAIMPGQYVIATTYLALIPEQKAHAKELGAAVIGTLPSMHGLVAFSIAGSTSCASLRTITAWQTEEDMLAFVMSPAHATAMSQISTLSRGSSDTISWEGDEASVTWAAAADALAKKQ